MNRTLVRRRRHPEEAPAPWIDHPKPVPILDEEDANEPPVATGIDGDLRHRLVSEAAFRHLCERGYAEGYEGEDWIEAESEVDGVARERTDR